MNAAVKFVLRPVADQILVVFTQANIIFFSTKSIIWIGRWTIRSSHSSNLEIKIQFTNLIFTRIRLADLVQLSYLNLDYLII